MLWSCHKQTSLLLFYLKMNLKKLKMSYQQHSHLFPTIENGVLPHWIAEIPVTWKWGQSVFCHLQRSLESEIQSLFSSGCLGLCHPRWTFYVGRLHMWHWTLGCVVEFWSGQVKDLSLLVFCFGIENLWRHFWMWSPRFQYWILRTIASADIYPVFLESTSLL